MRLPPSVTTVRIVFESPDLRCCIAIPRGSIREVVLQPLPPGPATVTLTGYPGNTAPAPPGGPTTVCPTLPEGIGDACVLGAPDTPSFTSDPTSLTIQPGGIADVGEIQVHSAPFLVAPSRMPSPGETAASPVQIGFVVADATSGIDPLSVQVELTNANGDTSALPMDLTPCDDASDSTCTPGGSLEVKGLRASAAAQILPAGNSSVRVIARNLNDPPQSLDTSWQFRAAPTPAPPTATNTSVFTATPTPSRTETLSPTRSLTPTVTATATASATRTVTFTETLTPTVTLTTTRRASPTSTLTPTIAPTSTPTPLPTLTPTPPNTSTPTPTRTVTTTRTTTATRTTTPTLPPCSQDAPQNPCILMGRSTTNACHLEWLFSPPPLLGAGDIPRRRLSCDEGSACDADAKRDGQCTFRLVLCINNDDPRRIFCAPDQVDAFEVRLPNPGHLADSADANNLTTLEGAAGANGFGVTVQRSDSVVFTGRPNRTRNLCSPPLSLTVPLRGGGAKVGKRTLKLRISTPQGISSSSVRLNCVPH